MITTLITGGAGFIGTNLCLKLLSLGHKVYCVDILMHDNQNDSDHTSIKHKNYTFLKYDIINIKYELFDQVKFDQIYHLACPASPPIYQKNPIHTINTCVQGTINICELAKINNCPILLTSTSEIYGEPLISPQIESYRGNVSCIGPRSCYDEGKRMAETIMFEYHHLYNVDIKVCRLFNTYGPYLDPNDGRVVSNFINQILNKKKVTIYGRGDQSRSFCYIDDLIEGLMLLMDSSITGPINLGNPNEISIMDLAKTIGEILKMPVNIEYKDLPTDDPTHRCPDISYARESLNWNPTTKLKDGLIKTIDYYKNIG